MNLASELDRAQVAAGHLEGLVWHVSVTQVKMEQHHVRFEKAISECDSESSWYSYISSGNNIEPNIYIIMYIVT